MERKHFEHRGFNATESQAYSMSDYAGIEATKEIIDNYSTCRNCLEDFGGFSDQEILYLIVSPEDRLKLEKRYNNIDFSKTVEKLNKKES